IATRLIDQLWGKVRHRQFFGYAEDACNFHPGVKGRWYVVYRYLNLKHSGLVLAWKISKTEIELTRKLHP
ncbi:hypothetical protein KC644_03655, partial [Candidatus Berkelbacteria bacterium]|nr:hypothetical protein [Candidatus Berkelbacteria bacterium]